MKKALLIATTLLCAATLAWATDYNVGTDSELRSAITNGANITVTADIDLSNSTLSIPSNATVTINLNGHKLDRGLTQRGEGGGQVITVREGATLNLSNGTLKGGWGGAGGALVNEGGTVELTDVTVTNNVADDRGGGVCNRKGGTLTMTNCSITNNHSNDQSGAKGGGGFFNEEGATATLTGVTITGNTAEEKGGGGICNFGALTLDGCSITGNTAGTYGGGIWQEGTLNMQGANTISGNTASSVSDNVYLRTSKVITVTGSLAGSSIGVNMGNATGTFTSGYSSHNSYDPATIFTSDFSSVMGVSLVDNDAKMDYLSSFQYIDCSWDDVNKQVVKTPKTLSSQIVWTDSPSSEADYKVVAGGSGELGIGGKTGNYPEFYVVRGTINRDAIRVNGTDVHLVLCDGAKLNVNSIIVNPTYKLHIHVQSYGSSMGKLHADNNGHEETAAGIGSESGLSHAPNLDGPGLIEIHGGTIYAKGGDNGAGIGGGDWAKGGTIVIYGGDIRAYGGDGGGIDGSAGAGIGGGNLAEGPINFTVYDGSVYAEGGPDAAGIGSGNCGNNFDYTIHHGGHFTMYGGYVEARGADNAAGIGGGEYSEGPRGVNIYGGIVKAYGGVDAAGIGSGYHWAKDLSSGTIKIFGGEVYSWGKDEGAGIGGGENAKGADVTITGGIIEAHAGENETYYKAIGPGRDNDNYGSLAIGDTMMVSSERMASAAERHDMCWYRTRVRIEPCSHASVTYTVDGTTAADHHISHCQYCNHTDTALHTFDEQGVCTVCGVQATAYMTKLYMPHKGNDGSFDGDTYDSISSHLVVPGSSYILPMATLKVPGLKFAGWEATTEPAGATYISPYTTDTVDTLYRTGNRYTVNANISFVARYKGLDITLLDNASNGETLSRNNGMTAHSVTLSGRTLYKDGHWNTLCLPFSLSAEQLAASPLAGCTLMQLDTVNTYEGKKTGFDPANGTLYLYFKDTTAITVGMPYIIKWAEGDNILNPVFQNVAISNVTVDMSVRYITFVGNYSPRLITAEDRSVLYLASNDSLHYPDGAMNINACRAYFQLNGILARELSSPAAAPLRIVSNLDAQDTATDVEIVEGQKSKVKDRGEKFIRDGQLYILRDGIIYDALGRKINVNY